MCKILGFSACVAVAAMLSGCCDRSGTPDGKQGCDPKKGECTLDTKDAVVDGAVSADDAAEVEEEAAE